MKFITYKQSSTLFSKILPDDKSYIGLYVLVFPQIITLLNEHILPLEDSTFTLIIKKTI